MWDWILGTAAIETEDDDLLPLSALDFG
jgi:hypothetical protein